MTAPKPKRKRPKVRYVADRADHWYEVLWVVLRGGGDPYFDRICSCVSPKAAKRIAAALNLYEATRRGEM